MKFDVLNTLSDSNVTKKYVPYDTYFGDMELSEEQKDERITLAKNIESVLGYVISLITLQIQNESLDMLQSQNEAFNGLVGALQDNGIVVDDYYTEYARKFSENFIDTTFAHIGEDYYLSMDRVKYNAENEANTILNHSDYEMAISLGYTKKRWIDMKDRKERLSHLEVDKSSIPIKQPFIVGKYKMLYPKDDSLGAREEEIINCRCSVKYMK